MSNVFIADADAIIALFSATDSNKQKAKQTLILLSNQNAQIYFPATAISEAITAAQRKLSNPLLAETIIQRTLSGDLAVFPIDQEIIILAASMYSPHGSKQNTFFDAIIAAIAKKHNATAIFSFDGWYKKQGFEMASDFVGIKE